MKKIYDSFIFFNELDLLEIRLTMLYPYVDYFVISECDYTFSGNKKPYYFDENKELFSKFEDKIIHIKHSNTNEINSIENNYSGVKQDILNNIIKDYDLIKNTPETDNGKPQWCREYLHREYLALGLSDCKDDDIIIFSDLDEIPNPEIIKNINDLNIDEKKYCLYLDNNNFFINNIASTNWLGSIISSYSNIKNNSLNHIRKTRGSNVMIDNGGWHLSFMGSVERIKTKIKSYAHQEFNNDHILNNIENKITENKDLFERTNTTYSNPTETFYFENMKIVNLDDYTIPKDIVNFIKNKFPYLIK